MSNDELFMARALELAANGRYTVSPNPMVGCVVVRNGAVLAEGWHRRAGGPHAEVEALNACADARGATVYVTLEPCSHQGRTPPCSSALIEAGVARVVVAMQDPHEVVDGRGIEALRRARIEVVMGVLEPDARRLNEKFIWSVRHNLPFVLLKAAITFDGKLATTTRESKWITSDAARERSLALREEYDAILLGGGTVRADNPRLSRRLGLAGDATPWTRVVLDGDGDVDPYAQILTDGGRTILFTAAPQRHTESSAVEIVPTPGRVDLDTVLGELYLRGIRSVIAEGGSIVHSDVIRHRLWQKLIVFVAPMMVGGRDAPALLGGDGVPRLTDAYRFRFDRCELVGGDLMIAGYPFS